MATHPIYGKRAHTAQESLHRWWNNGMIIDDRAAAEHALNYVGYFRLLIYARQFQLPSNRFRPRCRFSDVYALYEFDRALRSLCMEATERIEVGLRATLSNTMALMHGAHWFMDQSHFESFTTHHKASGQILSSLDRAKSNPAVAHYFSTYSDPSLPPTWLVCQKLSFGALSRLFAGLKIDRRKKIAQLWGLRENLLASWFRSATTLRNECAHHGRLWNTKLPIDKPAAHNLFPVDFHAPDSVYARLCAVKLMLDGLGYGIWFRDSLSCLLLSNPNVSLSHLAFPSGWESRPLWAVNPKLKCPLLSKIEMSP